MRDITNPNTLAAEVQTIVDAGGTITKKFQQTLARWEAFTADEYSVTEALHAAILDSDTTPERMAHLRIMAEAEAASSPVHAATVRNDAAAEILAGLRVEYRTVAAANYETIRGVFNDKAAQLVEALETTDPEGSAEQIVKATAKERAAWSDGPVLAVELGALVGTLHTAATLAGLRPGTGRPDCTLIGLTVNAEGLHRRRVWEAWNNTTGRAGRWRELWNLGATIEAPELDDVKPYREPRAMETRAEHTGLGIRQFQHDPEDDEHEGKRRDFAAPKVAGSKVSVS